MNVKNLFDLAGKVAVVTGGSRGLGLEIASGLGEAGATVAVTARREQWLTTAGHALRQAGIECQALQCDVSQPDQVDAMVQAVLTRFGRIDILINNAGSSWGAPAEMMPIEKWRAVLDTNATGCFLVSRAVGREMMRAARGGAIVNVASVMGLRGTSADILHAAGYSASKGAIISLTRDLAAKWAIHDIRVNAIAPGFFDTRLTTGMLEKSLPAIEKSTPMGRIGRPGEVKGVVLFLASSASSYVTGQVLAIDGGMTSSI